MKVFIKTKPNSREDRIKQTSENSFEAQIKELPVDGRANQALIRIFAEFLKIPKTRIKIVSGWKSKNKILEIDS